MPDREWWSALWPDPEGVLRTLGIEPHMTVLDLCCGDGYFTAPLAKLVGGRVRALDLNPLMIECAQEEVARQDATVRQWICANALEVAQHIPVPVDYVLMANTFHGVPNQCRLATEVRKVLRPGGRFGIVNWRSVPREKTIFFGQPRGPATELRMSPDDVAAAVEPAGFGTLQNVDLAPYHYGIVLRRST